MPGATPTSTESAANDRLEARVTARQKALFREAADLQGVTLTDFIVSSVHQAAMRILEARHVLEVSRKDQQVFVQALLRPAAPNARLRAAWARHARTVVRSHTPTGRVKGPRRRRRG
jgi:uncharacterized protein (DUF1778 family)